MLCDELGKLLVALVNALATVYGDDAIVTHVIPSPYYEEDGTILNVTIGIRDSIEDKDEKFELFETIIYNPILHSDWILSKVDIGVSYYG